MSSRLPEKPLVSTDVVPKRATFNPRVPGSIPGRPTARTSNFTRTGTADSLTVSSVLTNCSRRFLGTSAAARSAASRPTPSSRCEYVSDVIDTDECPRRLDTTASGTPAASISDA